MHQVADLLRLVQGHEAWLTAAVREGVADVMVPLYTGKPRRKRKGQQRPKGATGAALERTLDAWASRYPGRVH